MSPSFHLWNENNNKNRERNGKKMWKDYNKQIKKWYKTDMCMLLGRCVSDSNHSFSFIRIHQNKRDWQMKPRWILFIFFFFSWVLAKRRENEPFSSSSTVYWCTKMSKETKRMEKWEMICMVRHGWSAMPRHLHYLYIAHHTRVIL